MTTPRDPNAPRNPDQLINAFLDEGPMDLREQVYDEVRLEVDLTEQRTTFGPWRNLMATRFAGFAAVTAVVAGAVIVGLALSGGGPPPGTGPNPSADIGIFAPLAGRIVYEGQDGVAGVDPAAPADPASLVQLTSGAGLPLGWSADGSRLLLFREEQLVVLHADGSETRLTEPLSLFQGAGISPDGSRVVFANGTETPEGEWVDFALYAVAVDGGSAEVLAESQNGFVEAPTFSPDGTQIAYVDGSYDHGHHVWVMDADGTDRHEILANESTLQAGHVGALAWSPAGNRIALALGSGIYTFGTDGSDFTRIAGLGHGDGCYSVEECAAELPAEAGSPSWSPDGSQIAYTTGCTDGNGSADTSGCHLVIADADGSNRREFSYGMSGPWHPGTPPPSPVDPTTEPVVPSESAEGLPVGPHVLDPVATAVGTDVEDRVTVTIPAPGWFAEPDGASVTKDLGDFGLVTVVAVASDHYQVPPNICNWQAGSGPNPSTQNRIATTVDEMVAFLSEQTIDANGSITRAFLPPEDIVIDGYAGQLILDDGPYVSAYPVDPAGCDDQRFCALLDRDSDQCLLSYLEPGALDMVWIVDLGEDSPHLRVIASFGHPNVEFRPEVVTMVNSMTFHLE
jgi:Tol biopolymer transport system component